MLAKERKRQIWKKKICINKKNPLFKQCQNTIGKKTNNFFLNTEVADTHIMVCGVIQIPAKPDGETGQTEHGALFFQKAQPRRDCKQGGVRLRLVTPREASERCLNFAI